MTAITKALLRGKILGYLETHSVSETARKFKVSRNTVAAVRDGKLRRTDMDAARRKRRGKKNKGRTTIINARRRVVDSCLQQKTVQKEDKHGNVRVIPKFPTINSVRNRFRDRPLRLPKNNNAPANRARNAPGAIPSISTLRRDAKALGYANYVRPRVPYRQFQKPRRLKFCKNEDFQNERFVKRLLFSDEHFVTTNDNSSRTQWVKVHKCRKVAKTKVDPQQRRSTFNTTRRMFWAMIGWNYKSPIIWCEFPDKKKKKKKDEESDEGDDDEDDDDDSDDDEEDRRKKKRNEKKNKKKKKGKKKPLSKFTLNSDRYIEHILKKVKPKLQQRNMIFMQDGARAHTAKGTRDWLREANISVLENWPADSPDLNPIEELWAVVNRRLSELGVAHNPEQLKAMVEQVWAEIPMEMINNFVLRFMHKTACCVRNRGGNAK